ncbi:MAG: hypothetical protein FJX76_23690 [Armatimonadetes bacterium]|nr:hypothetical protein [Armatimonadota bacterium]
MDGASTSQAQRDAIREKVRELATISLDLTNLTRQMGAAVSTVQVGFLKDRVDSLTAQQRRLIGEIAASCPDPELKATFDGVDRRLETMREQVKDCKESDELETLRAEIDPLVDQWAELFQQLVIVTISAPSNQSEG